MSRLAGFTVYEDRNMVECVKKTWRERFTWRFWETHKIIPMKNVIVMNDKMAIFCHPSVKQQIEEQIEELI